jgi:hypothetical protein
VCNQSGTNAPVEYIAYAGDIFTIEWFFDEHNKSQAFDYYIQRNTKERAKILSLFKRIGDIGQLKDKTKFNYEGDQIFAFKPKPDRFLCFFFQGKKIIVTNAFRKKSDKLPKMEKLRAINNKRDFIARTTNGDYYE